MSGASPAPVGYWEYGWEKCKRQPLVPLGKSSSYPQTHTRYHQNIQTHIASPGLILRCACYLCGAHRGLGLAEEGQPGAIQQVLAIQSSVSRPPASTSSDSIAEVLPSRYAFPRVALYMHPAEHKV
jgi:hypothetical protein